MDYENQRPIDPSLTAPVIPVSLLNRRVRERLETSFPLCWVRGEISNLMQAASGHVYFTLKDAGAQVRCVMFRSRSQLLGWRLENGQQIEVRVLVTLYEARGDYQLNVENARRAGAGNLFERFVQLKAQLENEGLFAPERKRPLPPFPRRIGIVTSRQAAALRDVLTTLARRAPHVSVVLYPAPVQGEDAAPQLAAALITAGARQECDVLILCRGGGSIEDLWAFNDEALARAILASPIPVISGIGHETDFTIADFVADRRAPTPTAAAELAAPERRALLHLLTERHTTIGRYIHSAIAQRSQHIDRLALMLQHPAGLLERQRQRLIHLQHRQNSALIKTTASERAMLSRLTHRFLLARPLPTRFAQRLNMLSPQLHSAWHIRLDKMSARMASLKESLEHLDPRRVMARGYSIVTDSSGRIMRDSHSLEPNHAITVFLHGGRAEATVTSVSPMDGLPGIADE